MSKIMEKYNGLGGESSFLGKPLHEERACPDGIGRFLTFRRDSDSMISSIHFHPEHGCHETHGAIRAKWEALGFEGGIMGYPVTDEYARPMGYFLRDMGWVSDDGEPIPTDGVPVSVSKFQMGTIAYHPEFFQDAIACDVSNTIIVPSKGFVEKFWEKIFPKLPY